ncbi:MAG: hypothetical protein RR449_08245, partial [Christensenella sp.]
MMRDVDFKRAFDVIKAGDDIKGKTIAAVHAKNNPQRKKRNFAFAAMAAAICLVFLVGGSIFFMQPQAYISIDVNPSVELGVNRAGVVTEARAVNADGAGVLDEVDVNGKPYKEAIDLILSAEQAQGYLTAESFVTFAVRSDDAQQEQRILSDTRQCANGYVGAGQCESVAVSAELREEAHMHGVSPGKYRAILALMAADSTVSMDDCARMSMREIKT